MQALCDEVRHDGEGFRRKMRGRLAYRADIPAMEASSKTPQIPPDLVVKYQPLDIAEVILSLIRRQTSSKRCGETGNHGLSCSPHLRTIGLPLNPSAP